VQGSAFVNDAKTAFSDFLTNLELIGYNGDAGRGDMMMRRGRRDNVRRH